MTNCHPSWFVTALTYLQIIYAGIVGQINDFFEVRVFPFIKKWFMIDTSKNNFEREISPQFKKNWQKSYRAGFTQVPPTKKGYAPIFDLNSFESFYERRLYCKVAPGFHRPISSNPGQFIDILDRKFISEKVDTLVFNGETKKCLNLGSYNYLGFADNPPHVTQEVLSSLDKYGISTNASTNDWGYSPLHREMEKRIAEFLGKEDAIIFGMGFVTNSSIIPAVAEGEKTLIISDSLNHTSIVTGARMSGCRIKVFTHSRTEELEKILKVSIAEGYQPKTYPKNSLQQQKAKKKTNTANNSSKISGIKEKFQGIVGKFVNISKEKKENYVPWDKIIVFVEGVYSMEGEIVDLKKVVELKKKYGFYLYVDEAHSIGGVGKTGRGVCEFHGVNPNDVDVLMGTFTKSFGAVGGYISSSSEFINFLRTKIPVLTYGLSMPNGCTQQIISSHKVITGEDGTSIGKEKLKKIYENSNFFREGLRKLGFEVIGDEGSPVMIVMIYLPTQLFVFSKFCMDRGLAIVTVGPPASDLFETRARFCLSSAHEKESLENALKVLSEVGDLTLTKYMKYRKYSTWEKIKSLSFF